MAYKGVRYKSLAELADAYGFNVNRLYRRIHRMSLDEAMEQALSANAKLGGHSLGSTGR